MKENNKGEGKIEKSKRKEKKRVREGKVIRISTEKGKIKKINK